MQLITDLLFKIIVIVTWVLGLCCLRPVLSSTLGGTFDVVDNGMCCWHWWQIDFIVATWSRTEVILSSLSYPVWLDSIFYSFPGTPVWLVPCRVSPLHYASINLLSMNWKYKILSLSRTPDTFLIQVILPIWNSSGIICWMGE